MGDRDRAPAFTIYTQSYPSEVAYTASSFPDGQLHMQMTGPVKWEVPLLIKGRVTSPSDLLELQLLVEVLRYNNPSCVLSLTLTYLMGGRMDRRIDDDQPVTLAVVAAAIKGLGFSRIRLLDPHSEVSTALLGAEAMLPVFGVGEAACDIITHHAERSLCLVAPDLGATEWQ